MQFSKHIADLFSHEPRKKKMYKHMLYRQQYNKLYLYIYKI